MSVPVHAGGSCRCVPAPGPDEAVFRVRPLLGLSIADLLRGAVVAVLVFAGLVAAEQWELNRHVDGGISLSHGAAGILVLVYGFVPVVLVALAVGALVARVMRRVANQWWHLLAFTAAGAAIVAVPVALGGGPPWGPGVLSAAGAALAGRAVLWRGFAPEAAGQ